MGHRDESDGEDYEEEEEVGEKRMRNLGFQRKKKGMEKKDEEKRECNWREQKLPLIRITNWN